MLPAIDHRSSVINHLIEIQMSANKKKSSFLYLNFALSLLLFINSDCHLSMKLRDVSIPTDVKTVKVNFIENHARYVNPQLSPSLTDRLRQKIVNQTRLSQTNGDADWEVSGFVSDYSVSTAGISQQQTTINRLNVAVHITLLDRKKNNDQKEFDVSHSFDFSASLTLQAAEAQLGDDIVRNMTDEIFNQIFSNW
jgi:hypothetical protein